MASMPESLRWFLFGLTGELPLEADAGAALEVSRIYHRSSIALDSVAANLRDVMNVAMDALPTEVAIGFVGVIGDFVGQAGVIVKMSADLQEKRYIMANISLYIDESLRQIILVAVVLATELTILSGLVWTGPWAWARHEAAVAHARTAVRWLKQRPLLASTAALSGHSVMQSAVQTAEQLLIQLLSMVTGPEDRRRHALDVRDLRAAALGGALAGVGSATVVWALRPLVVLAGPKGSWKHGTAKELSVAIGASTEGAAESLATGVVYGHWDVDALPFAGGAVAHATHAGLRSGTSWSSHSVKSLLVASRSARAAVTHGEDGDASVRSHTAASSGALVQPQATHATSNAQRVPAHDAQPHAVNSISWQDGWGSTTGPGTMRSVQVRATPVPAPESTPHGSVTGNWSAGTTHQQQWNFAPSSPAPRQDLRPEPDAPTSTPSTASHQTPQHTSEATRVISPEISQSTMSELTTAPASHSRFGETVGDASSTDRGGIRLATEGNTSAVDIVQDVVPPPAELNSAPRQPAAPGISISEDGQPLTQAASHVLPSHDGEQPEPLVPSAGRTEDRAALEALETARRADPRFAHNDQGDLRELAATLLRGSDTQRRPTSTDLLQLTKRAMSAGRAGSLAALEAFHLQYDHGVLDAETRVATPSGAIPIRNWRRGFLPALQLDIIGTLDEGGRLVPEDAAWKTGGIYPVLPEYWSDGQFGIRGNANKSFDVSPSVLGELLRYDPMRPDNDDVVLFASSAGEQPEVPRAVADGIGRVVFAPSAELVLQKRTESVYQMFAFGRPTTTTPTAGRWIPGEPNLPLPGPDITLTGIDGGTVRASALLHYPLLSASGRSTVGGAVFETTDMRYRQFHYRYYGEVRHSTTQYPEGLEHAADLAWEPNRADGYNLVGHDGERGFLFGLQHRDGTTGSIELSGSETAQVLRRRSSFQAWKLRGNGTRAAINADFCGKRHRHHWEAQDPLTADHPGTDLATGTGVRVNSLLARVSIRRAEGMLPDRLSVVRADLPPDGRRSTQHWPMPEASELDALFQEVGEGLPVEDAADSRERVRRWVRAVRHDPALGLRLEGPASWTDPSQLRTSPEYRRLMKGFAALERMRLADPRPAPGADSTTARGPLDSAMWKSILMAHQRLHSLPHAGPLRLLADAATAVAADPERTLEHFLQHLPLDGADATPSAASSHEIPPRLEDGSATPGSAGPSIREPFDAQDFVRKEFGDYILHDPDLPTLVRGAEVLQRAWASGPPDRGTITLGDLAKLVPVRFPPTEYMPEADSHRALLRLAAGAAARGHSLAQLASIQLERHGALNFVVRPQSVSGAPVLDWHDVELDGLDLLHLRHVHPRGGATDHPAPWPLGSLYTIAGDPIAIKDYLVTIDVATDLVLTKALGGRRRDIVLLIPHAGAGTRPAVRRLATESGALVWSLDGTVDFVRAPDGANVATTRFESTKRPVARAIPTYPNPLLLNDGQSWFDDGSDTVHHDRNISAVTLLRSDGDVYGTAYVDPMRLIDDSGARGRLDGLDRASHYAEGPDGIPKPLPPFTTGVVLESAPGRVKFHASYGEVHTPSDQAAPFLLRTMDLGADDGAVLLFADGASRPGPDDVVGTPPLGQLLAEGTHRVVVVPVPSGRLRPLPLLRGTVLDLAPATSSPVGWVVFRPLPELDEVETMRRLLVTSEGDLTVTSDVIRLWDRLTHSLSTQPSAEPYIERSRDEQYLSLMRGFAALERMRAADAALIGRQSHEPMTEAIWMAVLEQHRDSHSWPRARPRTLLAQAHVTAVAVPGTTLASFLGSAPGQSEPLAAR
ncbi:hypothetical protein [Streptomyces zaomyceticus]|uniref:hypothetical protein n=1 Tax=Streptomyces zaomyceticus TaxID=68286 RepID=UPI0036D01444